MNESGGLQATTARRGWSRLIPAIVVPLALAALVLGQASWFAATTSETMDEVTYQRLGMNIFRQHDWQSLAEPMVPALPIVLEYWLPSLRAQSLPGSAEWDRQVPELIRDARFLTASMLGVPLVWLVAGWLARRRGWAVGAVGGALLALSPTFLAHASVATTDICFACFGMLATLSIRNYQVRPSRGAFLLMGVGIGLAIGAKQSGIVFFPVALLEILLRLPPRQPEWTMARYGLRLATGAAVRLALLGAVAFGTVSATYGFHHAAAYGSYGVNTPVPAVLPKVLAHVPRGDQILEAFRASGPPLALDTFRGQYRHSKYGHPAFLMGMHRQKGWWYYFPVAIGIKSTPVELILMAVSLGLACRPANWRDPARRIWLASALVMIAVGMNASINIGQRYMILIYPLAILTALDWLGERLAPRPGRALGIGLALVAWQATSVAGVMPQYLSYFNSAIGGPTQGYRYLVDSNLDWGQDLPALRRALEERQYHSVAFCFFGAAEPKTYGLKTTDWLTTDEAAAAACDWLAVSATNLMGAYMPSVPLYEKLGGLPSVRVGYSIFLYDLKDPRVRAAWDDLRRTAPPLMEHRAPLAPEGPEARPAEGR